ncbi:hypothetical protein [Leptothrix ochracea]|uniref:hypothetical protein n=1 Tax=Leptothrix ochracea TaxID=735331 RepID=UPI0034E27967
MIAKTLFWTLLLGLIASFAWHYHDAPLIQRWIHPPPPVVSEERTWRDEAAERPQAVQPGAAPVRIAATAATAATAKGGLRKCRQGSTVIYTDDACPAGMQELSLSGTVTVLKDQRKLVEQAKKVSPPGTETASPAGGPSPEGDKLPLGEDPVLRAKRMEQIIDR